MGSLIDDTTGCIVGYGQSKLTHFSDVGLVSDLVLKEDNDDNDSNHEDTTAVTDAHIHVAWHNIMEGNYISFI